MKLHRDQTHYEVLDVTPNASAHEIQKAHQEARSLYGEDALASYSFFSSGERVKMLTRIDEAYAALSDADCRAAYDRSVGIHRRAVILSAPGEKTPGGNGDNQASEVDAALREKVRCGVVNGDARRLARQMAMAGVVTGHDLKRLRQAVGLGVEEIEAGSIVGSGLIPALEEDRFEELPSWLVLRDSLMGYAALLQVNPEMIACGYMKHLTSRE